MMYILLYFILNPMETKQGATAPSTSNVVELMRRDNTEEGDIPLGSDKSSLASRRSAS